MTPEEKVKRNRYQARKAFRFYRAHIKLLQNERHKKRYTEIQNTLLDYHCPSGDADDRNFSKWVLERTADMDIPRFTLRKKWLHLWAFLTWRKL